MNVILREMKANRKSLIIWSIGILFMVFAGMGKYAGLETAGGSLNELMSQMPKSLQAIMGTSSLDLSTLEGYYGMLYLYLLIMATIHAAMLGATIISKEEQDKTAEFLFTKPVSRSKVISYKLVASFLNVLIFNLVTLTSSILAVSAFNEGESVTSAILLLMCGMFIVQLVFLLISTAVAAMLKKPKASVSVSAGIVLVAFIFSILIDINSHLERFKFVTPFKYFEAKTVLNETGLNGLYIIISFALIAGFTAITYIYYEKRDLIV